MPKSLKGFALAVSYDALANPLGQLLAISLITRGFEPLLMKTTKREVSVGALNPIAFCWSIFLVSPS
ncbi:MAG: hypothetical protein RLZZ69_2337 [Cyanobacteriota bacterium]|jgi:hypothetical protein